MPTVLEDVFFKIPYPAMQHTLLLSVTVMVALQRKNDNRHATMAHAILYHCQTCTYIHECSLYTYNVRIVCLQCIFFNRTCMCEYTYYMHCINTYLSSLPHTIAPTPPYSTLSLVYNERTSMLRVCTRICTVCVVCI